MTQIILPSLSFCVLQISQVLDEILYIQSQSPYCLVSLNNPRQKTIEFRVALQKLEKHFEGILIRVHRSYLISPHKILYFQKRDKDDYQVFVRNLKNETIILPVGRSYVTKLKEQFPKKWI